MINLFFSILGDAAIHNNIAASNTMNYSEDRATCDGYKENMCLY